MALEALLLSHDPHAQRIIRSVLDQLNMELRVCSGADEALTILNRRKFDALLVDCDDIPKASEVLCNVRKSKSNKGCVTIALVGGQTTVQQAFQMGANFVLDKPVVAASLARSLRAAQGLIIRDRRRYHRHLLNAKGVILVDTGVELPVSIINLSEGGISIECTRKLEEGGAARLRVLLPGSKMPLDLKGEVVWTTHDGRAGIRFQVMPIETKRELHSWMEKRGVAVGAGAVFINATGTS